jgi:hypothetical protein
MGNCIMYEFFMPCSFSEGNDVELWSGQAGLKSKQQALTAQAKLR